jgi:hypothetical protein
MKNVLIGMLTLALVIAAFLTRPTEDDFADFVRRHTPAERPRTAGPTLAQAQFKDCWLWVEVTVDGETIVAGLFNHWWDRAGRMERA